MKNFILLLSFMLFAGMAMGQALKVAADGNVGVGEAAPVGKLHVSGNSGLSNIIVSRLAEGGTTEVNFANMVSGLNGSGFYYRDDRIMGFGPANVNTFNQIDPVNSTVFFGPNFSNAANAGNVGIGTLAPTEKLEVGGLIKSTGQLVVSDARLKTITKNNMDFGLDALMNLNVIEFEYNGKGGTKANDRHIGLVAQELQKVAPSLVQEYTHVTYRPDSEAGLQYVGEEQFLEIRDSEIKYLLLNAIQDQQEIIVDQEERIADLENALVEIRGLLANNNTPINVAPSTANIATLGQNEPNPFSDRTSISYSIPEGSTDASLRIFSVTGQLIETVQITQTGSGKVQLDNANLTNGTYTYQLIVDGRIVDTNKMISQR